MKSSLLCLCNFDPNSRGGGGLLSAVIFSTKYIQNYLTPYAGLWANVGGGEGDGWKLAVQWVLTWHFAVLTTFLSLTVCY